MHNIIYLLTPAFADKSEGPAGFGLGLLQSDRSALLRALEEASMSCIRAPTPCRPNARLRQHGFSSRTAHVHMFTKGQSNEAGSRQKPCMDASGSAATCNSIKGTVAWCRKLIQHTRNTAKPRNQHKPSKIHASSAQFAIYRFTLIGRSSLPTARCPCYMPGRGKHRCRSNQTLTNLQSEA